MSNPLIASREAFDALWPEQHREVNGRTWGMVRAGETGPALILLPGTLGRADIFWQQITALQDEARVLALSYPGAGGVVDWAGDIAALIESEGLEGATVLGSSLGGYVAQYTTAQYPGLCGGLVAANTMPDASIVGGIPPYALDLKNIDIDILRNGFLDGLRNWTVGGHPYADLAELLAAAGQSARDEARQALRLNELNRAAGHIDKLLPEDQAQRLRQLADAVDADPNE